MATVEVCTTLRSEIATGHLTRRHGSWEPPPSESGQVFSIRARCTFPLDVPVLAGGVDCCFTGSFRMGEKLVGADPGSPDRFEWNTEQVRLTIWLEADEWWIQQTMPNPLLGPMVTSKASHRQAKQAVWDVLSRVTKATRDNEEGVRVASSAARWMRQIGEARTVTYCD